MNLIWFHRVLIGVAIVFFVGFGIWELLSYRDNHQDAALALGVSSIIVAIGLGIYLARLKRILKLPD